MRVCSEIKNRGTRDVLMVVCDGLKGLPERGQCRVGEDHRANMYRSFAAEFIQIRVEKGLGADRERPDLKPVYTAASESEALDRFAEFSGKWEKRYPAIIRLWENAWAEFVPFLRFDREIRTVICTTNAIESINARLRRAVNARGHFPTVMWNLRPRQAAARFSWGSSVTSPVRTAGRAAAGSRQRRRRADGAWTRRASACPRAVRGACRALPGRRRRRLSRRR